MIPVVCQVTPLTAKPCHLIPAEQEMLFTVLDEFADCFSDTPGLCPSMKFMSHLSSDPNNPGSTGFLRCWVVVAEWLEHRTRDTEVMGSNLIDRKVITLQSWGKTVRTNPHSRPTQPSIPQGSVNE